MRAGRIDEAYVVARRIGKIIKEITRRRHHHLRNVDPDAGLENLWKKVGACNIKSPR